MTEDEQTIERIEAQIFERYQQSGTDYLVDYLEGEQSAIDLNFYPAHERAALIKSRFASARKPPRDALKSIVADILQRHIAAAIDEIASVMTDEIEALARDRLADLRTQLESGSEP